jgi:hypothetical protein
MLSEPRSNLEFATYPLKSSRPRKILVVRLAVFLGYGVYRGGAILCLSLRFLSLRLLLFTDCYSKFVSSHFATPSSSGLGMCSAAASKTSW